jgi:membrane protein implicated in regulation of membrane protease activity
VTPGPWARRIPGATLPIGVALLIVWIVYVAAALVIGSEQFGLTIVQAVLSLLTSLILIVSGHQYRRSLSGD